MPRRTSFRTVTSSPQAPPSPQQRETPYDSNVRQLRRHWKWAAFSQFFFTFSPLISMTDVTLTDVENDLVHSTNHVLVRIMQRLLITLTQDRKITTESWQNALRRQYQRRDPGASPIGLMGRSHVESSRASLTPPVAVSDMPLDKVEHEDELLQREPSPDNAVCVKGSTDSSEEVSITTVKEKDTSSETPEAPEKLFDWLDLSMLVKLESLHTLAEWQFQNPHRVRHQMKTDDELATWRIEPIGYDSKRNAYWLIGSDRLWIQRERPRPNLKRKRKPAGNATKQQLRSPIVKRQRIDLYPETVGKSSRARPTRGKAQSQPSPSIREGRAAKTRANQRLDAQAKDIAQFQSQSASFRPRTTITLHKPTGIRVSARLRGAAVEDDEWQEVPDEWLAVSNIHAKDPPSGPLPLGKKKMKTGLETEGSSASELTKLSDDEDDAVVEDSNEKSVITMEETNPASAEKDMDMEIEDQHNGKAKSVDPPVTPPPTDDFVEWETICVTLEEWESIAQQFEKATHYTEKALYKALSENIVPMVTAEIREAEKKRHIEEAVVYRKRSSRIAMKEIEREEERTSIRKRLEEEEKTSRARRLEARHQKEQADRLRRENLREQRRMERELQEQSPEACEGELKHDTSVDIPEVSSCNLLSPGQTNILGTPSAIPINGIGSGSRSPLENWELDCEVCEQKSINQDDGVPLLCCGICGKWQHIACHDKQDAMTGHPKRNWDTEDFYCRKCRLISKNSSPSTPATFLPSGVNIKREQPSNPHAYYVPSSNLRNYSSNGNHSPNARYPYDYSEHRTIVPSTSVHSYSAQTRSTGVTFAHYQPHQGGFSTSRPTYSLQDDNPQHARYAIMPQTVSAAGTAPYPSTIHSQTTTHSPAHVHEQWHRSSSHPRTINTYSVNSGPPLLAQGVQPYYDGHAHAAYSHTRGTTNPTVLGQCAGFQHVPSYQHGK